MCLYKQQQHIYFQLQGELQARGQYAVHYKNFFHAFYVIGRSDGIVALQSGLVPALWYQFFMNGIRLGTYQILTNIGMTKDSRGKPSVVRNVIAGGIAGGMGAFVGSPMYMVIKNMLSKCIMTY